MGRSVVKIVTQAQRANFNAIGAAMGLGNLVSVDLGAPGNSAVTHAYGNDESMSAALAETFAGMVGEGGVLPDISPAVWGENGVVSEANAEAACLAAQIYIGVNCPNPATHAAEILSGLNLEEKSDI